MKYIIAYDVGTTSLKAALFKVDKKIELIADANDGYPLYTLPNGGSEQDPNDWWKAMQSTTKEIFSKCKIKPNMVDGISFCSQMQSVVIVDKDGNAIRRSMGYMDQRATEEVKKGISYGLQIANANIFKLIPSLVITGAVTSTPKDPVWKYKWIEAHEPENFKKIYKWLDVKDYLTMRCTDRFTMTRDDAFSTLILDSRDGKYCWSKKMCKMFNINMEHLPEIIKSCDVVGELTEKAAKDLGLVKGIKVFGGGGDSSLLGIGAGSTKVGDTHIYCGTSGWVSTVTDKRLVDTTYMIAAITGAIENRFNYFAEMETAGKCFEWVRDHLCLDEINIYLEKKHVADPSFEEKAISLYTHMNHVVEEVPAGSNGIIFTPWLHGNRCPFEDPNARGMFFGVGINTKKRELLRSVLEGIYFHLRWMLECQDKKVKTSDEIMFVGGGAISHTGCRILANILGRTIKTTVNPQNAGSVGAAIIAAVGLNEIPSIDDASKYIEIYDIYKPDMKVHAQYEPYYQLFKKIYNTNKKLFKEQGDILK